MDTQKLQGLGNLWIEHGTLGYTCIVHYSSRQTHVVLGDKTLAVTTLYLSIPYGSKHFLRRYSDP